MLIGAVLGIAMAAQISRVFYPATSDFPPGFPTFPLSRPPPVRQEQNRRVEPLPQQRNGNHAGSGRADRPGIVQGV
jgi:hypothetical protein